MGGGCLALIIPRNASGTEVYRAPDALRAFIAKGRTSIRLVAQDDPGSPFDDASPVPTSLGTGEALVTERSEKGLPTPLARTMMAAPRSRMGTVSDAELAATVATSAPAAT